LKGNAKGLGVRPKVEGLGKLETLKDLLVGWQVEIFIHSYSLSSPLASIFSGDPHSNLRKNNRTIIKKDLYPVLSLIISTAKKKKKSVRVFSLFRGF
jgi:hypothetical protein